MSEGEKIVAIGQLREDGSVELLHEIPEDECPPEILAELRARTSQPDTTGLVGTYRRTVGRVFKRLLNS
jgi:hypothetical protein